jgi:hypothetical protein
MTAGRRAALLLAVAVCAGGCAGSTGSSVTAAQVTGAFGGTFGNLYLRQQRLLGHPELTRDWVSSRADCLRHGGGAADRGAGDDWECRISWRAADGTEHETVYEVLVRTSGCFTASGPQADVGQQLLHTRDGRQLVNPIYQFDGCFDPS